MDSVASFSFCVVGVGVMVMLAGQMLGSAVFCVLKISSTIKIKLNKNQKKPSNDPSVALDVFLSSLKCEMNDISHRRGVYIV